MQHGGDVRDHRRDLARVRERLVARALERHRRDLVVVLEHEVVVTEHALQFLAEAVGVEEVLHAQRAPRDLVLVGRADAAAGGADLLAGGAALARLIERDVEREDERARGRDRKPVAHLHSARFEFADFGEERRG